MRAALDQAAAAPASVATSVRCGEAEARRRARQAVQHHFHQPVVVAVGAGSLVAEPGLQSTAPPPTATATPSGTPTAEPPAPTATATATEPGPTEPPTTAPTPTATEVVLRPNVIALARVELNGASSGRGALPLDERVRLELDYIERYSLWRDLAILARTIPAVVRGEGAF